MEESWETGERDVETRRREKTCSSENYGIGKVSGTVQIDLHTTMNILLSNNRLILKNYYLLLYQAHFRGASASEGKTENYADLEKG